MSGSWSICRRLTESRCINFRFAQSGGAISSLGLVVLLTVQFLVSRLVRCARPLWDLEVGLVGEVGSHHVMGKVRTPGIEASARLL